MADDHLIITEEDLTSGNQEAVERGPIQVEAPLPSTSSQPPSPLPPSAVVMPSDRDSARPPLTVHVRETAQRARQALSRPPLKSTKLRVLVQAFPDGPGYYGVQVKVACNRIRSHVAGTTNRQGVFLCELPVRESEGLTYDVDVFWPADMGGTQERKSITLNADRTEFLLPFYQRLQDSG